MAVAGPLPGGARHRQRIDAAMGAEAPVLVGEQHLDKARIDVVDGDRQTPAAVRRGVGAEQPAVAVDHLGGEFDVRRGLARDRATSATTQRQALQLTEKRSDDRCSDCGKAA